MNEFIIQNYLIFSISWFGAFILLSICIFWMVDSIPYKKNKSTIKSIQPEKNADSIQENPKKFSREPIPSTKINSPAMRGIHPYNLSSDSAASHFAPAPSLHIVRANNMAVTEKKADVALVVDAKEASFQDGAEKTSALEMEIMSKDNQQNKIDFSTLSGEDIERTQLDLAQALFESGRIAFANSILKELMQNATDPILKMEAQQLLASLALKIT